MKVIRFSHNPIITLSSIPVGNINGPSLIKIPAWVRQPLGQYYLYFAHHRGSCIRLAVADNLEGPWHVVAGGTLHREQTIFDHHIASPDVHIDSQHRLMIMYFHGKRTSDGKQLTCCAISEDGLHFYPQQAVLGHHYFRVFEVGSRFYAIAHNEDGSVLYQSPSFLGPFEKGGSLLPQSRHTSVLIKDHHLYIFYSTIGDSPEHLQSCSVSLNHHWLTWGHFLSDYQDILFPEYAWEGADFATVPSQPGAAVNVRQLRDPAIFCELERYFLLYSVAGEMGIALAEIIF